jgi:hypothetical protein
MSRKEQNKTFLAFALQHAGKNLFDQEQFQEALSMFVEALELRTQIMAPAEQIYSTEFSIKVTKSKLENAL